MSNGGLSPKSKASSNDHNLFKTIDKHDAGFVIGVQVADTLEEMKEELKKKFKIDSMIEHVKNEMSSCIITEEVFKNLSRQFKKHKKSN